MTCRSHSNGTFSPWILATPYYNSPTFPRVRLHTFFLPPITSSTSLPKLPGFHSLGFMMLHSTHPLNFKLVYHSGYSLLFCSPFPILAILVGSPLIKGKQMTCLLAPRHYHSFNSFTSVDGLAFRLDRIWGCLFIHRPGCHHFSDHCFYRRLWMWHTPSQSFFP